MKVLLSGGGTAGHINPALAIAGYIKDKDSENQILFIGNELGMEQKLVSDAGYDIESILISGFKRKVTPVALKENVLTVKRMFSAEAKAKKIIKNFSPDICIGTGGYVSGPTIKAAQSLKIPTLIHEQNAYPGITNKMLAKKADTVMLAVQDAEKYMPKPCNIKVVGNPVRKEIFLADKKIAREKLSLDDRPVILSFGGSLGAKTINEAVYGLIADTCKTDKYQHIHAYGKYGEWMLDKFAENGINLEEHPNIRVSEYINNMSDCMASADLVICRAGAITISEIEAVGKATILIPSPNVAENHQYHNAMALVNRDAADIIEDRILTGELLTSRVKYMINNPEKLQKYSKNAKNMAISNSCEKIFDIIQDTLSK